MPTYEYECGCCGAEIEEIQSISEPPLERCPKCHLPALKRLISKGTSFVLKGGGWANDLYSSSTPKAPS